MYPKGYKRVQQAKTLVGKFNHYIFMSTDSENPNSYYLLYRNELVARIYMYNEQWFVWYEQLKARVPVKSFTSAINLLEREIVKKCTEHPVTTRKKL